MTRELNVRERRWDFRRSVLWLAVALAGHGGAIAADQDGRRTPTVRDSIAFRTVGAPPVADDSTPVDAVPIWSPDRRQLALVLTHGDLASNRQVSEVLIYTVRSRDLALARRVTLQAGDNVAPVAGLQWVSEGALAFIALNGEPVRQVWRLDTVSGALAAVTASATDVISFAMAGEGIVFLARPSRPPLLDAASRRDGFVVGSESLTQLLTNGAAGPAFGLQPELFVRFGAAAPRRVTLNRGDLFSSFAPAISPDGRYAVMAVARAPGDSPPAWAPIQRQRPQAALYTYRLVDLRSAEMRPLIQVPLAGLPVGAPVWSPAGDAVVISGVASPDGSAVRDERWMLQVTVADQAVTPLMRTEACAFAFGGDRVVRIGMPQPSPFGARCAPVPGSGPPPAHSLAWATMSYPDVAVEQSMTRPPRIMVQRGPDAQHLLLDPNPQLRTLRLSRGEEMAWRVGDRNVRGALYLPPRGGRRLPLIIQIRSYDPSVFSLDGGFASNGAAQALVASGFAVVQVGLASVGGVGENATNLALIEQIVESLAARGRIDPARVGLWGFSRSGMAVRHAIAFSRYRFAAAVLADSLEAGYVTYATSAGTWGASFLPASLEPIYGGPPVGRTLTDWMSNAATFNFERWHTPVWELRFGSGQSLEEGWETLNMLRRLDKPVELMWLPDAAHGIVRPSDRMAVQGGAVDWFRFWLQDRTDDDPAKVAQYRRWSSLRVLHERDLAKSHSEAEQPDIP